MAPGRRWLQFSLRPFLVVLTIGCVWLASLCRQLKNEEDAIAMIRGAYGLVEYEPTFTSRYGVSRGRPITVCFLYADARRIDFAKLRTLTSLRRIDFQGTPVSDNHLCHLATMTHLEVINLTDTRVSRSGINRLQSALPQAVIGSDFWCGGVVAIQAEISEVTVESHDDVAGRAAHIPMWEPPHNATQERLEEESLLKSLGPLLGGNDE